MNFSEFKRESQSQKVNKQLPPSYFGYSWHRELSARLSYFLLRVFPGVTPNNISLLMILVGVLGCLLLLGESIEFTVVGILLVYLSFILDKVDGEIARYKNLQTLRGKYLDELYHALVTPLFIFCFFIQQAYLLGLMYVALVTLCLFLSIFRRFERKWCLATIVMKQGKITTSERAIRRRPLLVRLFVDNLIVRLASVVERFDVLILLSVIITLATYLSGESAYQTYLLLIYTVLSITYTFRWILLNYFGEFESIVIDWSDDLFNRK
jgi:phosphatidylglycerophosphate synthase